MAIEVLTYGDAVVSSKLLSPTVLIGTFERVALALVLASVAAAFAADIILLDLDLFEPPKFMQGARWRYCIAALWFAFLVVVFAWILGDVHVSPASNA
jgi:hypothetical protein